MKKMNVIKITLVVIVLGFIAYQVWDMGAFDKLDPPQPIKEVTKIEKLPTQMVIDVIMPAYIRAEQIDIDLHHRDPEVYANRFNSNNELYNRSVTFAYENGVMVGDTVQLKYFHQYDPPQKTYWDLASTKQPFYESVENGQYTYIEYTKGVVKEVN